MAEFGIKEASDEELEEILRKAENTHVSGSRFEQAQIELKIRRDKKLFEHQEKLLTTLQTKLNSIIQALNYIAKKPLRIAFIAIVATILIGIIINFTSALIIQGVGLR